MPYEAIAQSEGSEVAVTGTTFFLCEKDGEALTL